ncbi:MAG: PAS domain S-box protein, partial [Anaerolineae bacterium]|nr:PAS domain S-box protein [Anaerolineae bacterium]
MNETSVRPVNAVQPDPLQRTTLQAIGTQLADILETTSDGVLVLNETGIVYANPAMSGLWGIPLRELQAQGFDWTSLLDSAARVEAKQVLRTFLEGSEPTRMVTFEVMTRHLGRRSFTGSLTRLDADEPRLLAILHDISDRLAGGTEWEQRTKLLNEIERANHLVLAKDLDLPQLQAAMEILRRATRADRVCVQVTLGPALASRAETVQAATGTGADLPQLSIPPRWRTMLADDLPVKAITADLPPEERQALEAQGIQALLAFPLTAGGVCRGLIRFDRVSTDILWSKDTITLLQTAARVWVGALALVEIQSALRDSEERYRRLVENSPDFIYRMSLPDGRYEYASPAVLDMTGYTAEVFQTRPNLIREIIHPGWWNYFETQWAKLLNGDMPPTYEYAIIHGQTGETRWLHQRNVLLKDESGAPIAAEGIVTDITARKQAEMALHAQQSMLQSVFQATSIGIGIVSDRTLLRVNRRFCEMTGYEPEELIGRNTRMLYPTEADYNYVGNETYAQIKRQGTGTVETRCLKKDGTIIDVQLSSTPFDAGDLSAGVTFTALDITDRKRGADQMRASLQQTELLLKRIHHRVNGDLTAVSSLLGLQATRIDDPHVAQILQRSRDRVRAVAHVHEQLHSSSDVTQVNMEDYTNVLVGEL